MTEVRIRFDYQAESRHLADVPIDELDNVIPILERWGGVTGLNGTYESDFMGQFVLDSSGAYFEIVTCGEAT